jgi:transcriptional regulator with PAS, ATPase and Fis domain
MSRILFISTYTELAETARDISTKLKLPLTVFEGGILKGGHLFAKEKEKNYDVIISQGGTAAAIKSLVNIPVISIEISIMEFLNALLYAKKFNTKIGVIVYRTENLNDIENLRSILGIDFKVFPYSTREELIEQIEDATSTDEKLTVIGMGSCVTEIALEKKLNCVLVKSSRKAVEQAIHAAKNICDLSKREKERAERLKTVIDYSGEGIIALDRDGTTTTFNPTAEKIFNIPAENVVGKHITSFVENGGFGSIYEDGSYEAGKIFKVNNVQIFANRVPVIVDTEQVGTVITIQEVTNLQKIEQKVRTELYNKGMVARYSFKEIVGESQEIKDTIEKAKKYAQASTTVLIEGETGSGKELFAQSIHNASTRKDGPFVAINCAALPESLLESELFGYVEGAFTGAKKGGKPGLFELAHKGTIFLDEIGEMPLSLQSRLLRVLQEREVLRIGGDYILNVDIRVIAATNLNLYKMVKEHKFREDLYYRINVLNLKIPPLSQRKEDIPLLVKHLMGLMNKKHLTKIREITENGMNLLKSYQWPGNIRELENFIEKMVILANGPVIDKEFTEHLLMGHIAHKDTSLFVEQPYEKDAVIVEIGDLREMELQIIRSVSNMVKGDKNKIAEKLGISRTTLWKKLKELDTALRN